MIDLHLPVNNDVGLHARPAALFVKTANQFHSKIQICNATRKTPYVDAKSILKVLSLGAEKGHEIAIQINGEDEKMAAQTLEALVRSNFANAAGRAG